MSQKANLRVCASCEWIYRGVGLPCPRCGFGSYGARFVYGDACYRYERNQKPWLERKVARYTASLNREMKEFKRNDR